MKFYTGVYYDRGPNKTNEDSLLLEQIKTRRGRILLAAVADGIGGLKEGEIASGATLEIINNRLFKNIIPMYQRGKGLRAIRRLVGKTCEEIHEELREYALNHDLSLGTTISILFIFRRRYIIFHLGDSKIFLCKNGNITPLTVNHSKTKGSVSKCIGSFMYFKPDITTGYIFRETGFLLSTDGFYNLMDCDGRFYMPNEMGDDSKIEKRLMEMGALIKKRGQSDNASALYVRCI